MPGVRFKDRERSNGVREDGQRRKKVHPRLQQRTPVLPESPQGPPCLSLQRSQGRLECPQIRARLLPGPSIRLFRQGHFLVA